MKARPGKTVAAFGKDGLRVLTRKTFTEAEWNFSALADENAATAQRALAYELARECKDAHAFCDDYQRALKGRKHSKACAMLEKKWPRRPSQLNLPVQWWETFPAPALSFPPGELSRWGQRNLFPTIEEMDAEWFAWNPQVAAAFPNVTVHLLKIDWSKGKPHAEAELLKWFASIPKPPVANVTQKKRPGFQQLKDAFAQLVAWRAQRAGLTHAEWCAIITKAGLPMLPKGPLGWGVGFVRAYDNPSAFRNAAERGAERIEKARAHLLSHDWS